MIANSGVSRELQNLKYLERHSRGNLSSNYIVQLFLISLLTKVPTKFIDALYLNCLALPSVKSSQTIVGTTTSSAQKPEPAFQYIASLSLDPKEDCRCLWGTST